MIRADGVIPSMDEMYYFFGHRPLETVQTHLPLPKYPYHLGSKVVFRNIGNYNDVRNHMQRHGAVIQGVYRFIAE